MTEAEEKAEKTLQMGAKTASDAADGLVIPRLPFLEIPQRTAKAFPELAQWHRDNHDALEQWREKTNVVLSRKVSETIATPAP